jgi:S-adenosylmethionine hydrolase
MSGIITLLTDFGTADAYVGEVKGVLLSTAPGTTLVDIAHDIPPGDVVAAAWALGRAWAAYPEGTVHLAVVDPGVGTARRAVAVLAAGHRFVGPDNGIFTPALERSGSRAFALPIPKTASPTFHARDVFAPAAARLAAGAMPADLGSAISDPVRLERQRLGHRGGNLVGRVVHVDRFGTLVTNIPGARVAAEATVRIGPYDLQLRRTFADVAPGDPLALIGSGGFVEIAIRDGRADTVLGATRGAEVSATAAPVKRDSRMKGRPSEP